MKIKLLQKITVILFFMLSVDTFAARVSSPWFIAQQIGGDSNGPFVVIPPTGTVSGCPYGFQWWLGQSGAVDEGYKVSVSVVTAAYFSGKEMIVDYEDSTSGCYVYQVRVRN